ncbi:hypothetical protein KFL_015190010 [Klebsormidium nitens]|uniref:Uncharacterized protein n=1 Tax=Klebsormidium nitens TaxID=105231 RepID=A0A1Y1IXE1_KLENI|nr:hypothetical protein KFL_015190010 [Klebsormidium nitens]|eukprot:GAQ93427.1 hypothetical protein KFL_015190010 [Klebsormidium nitens]
MSEDGVIRGYLCSAGFPSETLFVDVAVTQKQRLDQGFEEAKAELLKESDLQDHVEGRLGDVYASYDPSELHACLSNIVLTVVLQALDQAGGGDVWFESLDFCSSATSMFGEDHEEAKEPDSFLAPVTDRKSGI